MITELLCKVILVLCIAQTTNGVNNDLSTVHTRSFESYIGTEHSIQHDGLRRWFVEYPTPPDITSSTKPPLLIILHFGGGNMHSSVGFGRFIEKDTWLQLCYQYGFLAISPNAVATRRRGRSGYNTKTLYGDWNDFLGGRNKSVIDVDDVGFISSIVQWAIEYRNVDPNRVYITGISSGGMMTLRMIIERPYMFAGAAAMVGSLPEWYIPPPSSGTPIYLLFGTKDARIPFAGGEAAGSRGKVRSAEATRDYFVAANNVGPTMIETVLPDVDTSDNCIIVSQYYPHNITPVIYYVMQGGGHNPVPLPNVGLGTIPATPKYFGSLLQLALGNACYDADNTLLAWLFMSNFTLQKRI